MCRRGDRAALVAMDHIQPPSCSVLCLLRERRPLLLADQACVAQLINMIQLRQTTHQALLCEPPECVEAEVSEPIVPLLGAITGARQQRDRPCQGEGDLVQPIRGAAYLCEKLVLRITHPQNPFLNHDLAAKLIDSAEANDVAPEARDEVRVGEGLMSSMARREEDGPAPDDVHHGAVAELHRARDGLVQLGEGSPVPRHVV